MQNVEIRFQGCLGEDWKEWFEGFTLTHCLGDETTLTGPVQDQAALYGLISKLRDLGISLIAVKTLGDPPEWGVDQ